MRKGVQKIYSEIAGTYEKINHLLTFGLDIHWRNKAARLALTQERTQVLDVCTGTGEMAQAVARLLTPEACVVSADFSYTMLARARLKKNRPRVFFTISEAGDLPFREGTFDLVTISFATRNLNIRREVLLMYLREFHRVLAQQGVLVNLETSQPPNRLLRRLFHTYVKIFVRPIGSFFSGSKSGYRYLAHTIPRFCSAGQFASLLQMAGFSHIEQLPLLGGIAAIHLAEK